MSTSTPEDSAEDDRWRFVVTGCQSSIAWFSGTHLGQPSTRDYSITPASESEEEEEAPLVSLTANESTPFPGTLIEGITEEDATFYRDLHIQLRNIYRTNDDARVLSAKMAATEALRQQLLQAIAQLGQSQS